MSNGHGECNHVRFAASADLNSLYGAMNGPLQDGFREDDFDLAFTSLDDLDAVGAEPVFHVEGHIVSDDSDAHIATPLISLELKFLFWEYVPISFLSQPCVAQRMCATGHKYDSAVFSTSTIIHSVCGVFPDCLFDNQRSASQRRHPTPALLPSPTEKRDPRAAAVQVPPFGDCCGATRSAKPVRVAA